MPLRCGLRGRTGAAFLVACCFPLCGEELREANQQQHSGKEAKGAENLKRGSESRKANFTKNNSIQGGIMSPFDVQSIVYICIGINTEIENLEGEVIGDRVFDGGYECADGCPGGMYETTHWVMNNAFPILEKAANGREEEMGE